MSYPAPPPSEGSITARSGPAPSSVRTAQMIVYALVALSVIRTIAAIAAKDTLVDYFVESRDADPGSEYGQRVVAEGAPAFVPIAIISLVIFGGLLLLLAYFFSQGKSWARIVAVVVCVLGALGGLLSLFQPAPIWYQLLGVLAGLLSIAVIVFLFRPDSNEFFRHAA